MDKYHKILWSHAVAVTTSTMYRKNLNEATPAIKYTNDFYNKVACIAKSEKKAF